MNNKLAGAIGFVVGAVVVTKWRSIQKFAEPHLKGLIKFGSNTAEWFGSLVAATTHPKKAKRVSAKRVAAKKKEVILEH